MRASIYLAEECTDQRYKIPGLDKRYDSLKYYASNCNERDPKLRKKILIDS